MEYGDKHILVLGAGASGIGASWVLAQVGAHVVLNDYKPMTLPTAEEKRLVAAGVTIITGRQDESLLDGVDRIVISPGISLDIPIVKAAQARGIDVVSEVELAYEVSKSPIVAVTGTNGKTTTTTLLTKVLEGSGKPVRVGGNIGDSLSEVAYSMPADGFLVAELSSYQLETIKHFRPIGAIMLNITPDHLNRHYTMDCYVQTKEKIAMNQKGAEVCVLNFDDDYLREFGEHTTAKVVWFSRFTKPDRGAYMEGDMICYTDGIRSQELLNVHDMNLIGAHNYENVMAAVCITKAAGIPDEIIVEQIKQFKAVEHRIEFVTEKNGVRYYNDSKGTNPEAAVKAIEAMTRPTVLIGGGYDKGSEFDLYVKAFKDRVKLLVLIGQTSDKIEATAKKYGFTNIIKAESLKEVVDICAENAKDGDAVLLSPACASWGMFDNYEQRGRLFKEYVNAL